MYFSISLPTGIGQPSPDLRMNDPLFNHSRALHIVLSQYTVIVATIYCGPCVVYVASN